MGSPLLSCRESRLRLLRPPGYIDLSKRRVSAEEVVKCEEQYEKGKTVDSIIVQVAKKSNVDPEKIYESVVWPLSKKYGHAYEAFKVAITWVVRSPSAGIRY